MTLLVAAGVAVGVVVAAATAATLVSAAGTVDRGRTFLWLTVLGVVGTAATAVVSMTGLAETPASAQTLLATVVFLTLVASVTTVTRIDRAERRWTDRLRSRFLFGVPWGTVLTVAFVAFVYLFVQGGAENLYDPVTVAFRAWSFLYPLGIITAAFSHAGFGHVVGNLTATLVLAPIAEFAWGHYTTRRGSSSFGSLRSNPYVRAVAVFPGAVLVVGFLTAALSIGPVIGFSGVVFAFAGFALVRYPVATVLGTVASNAVSLVYYSLQTPVITATPSPSPPAPPWWAGIAIQGHALGLFVGALLAIAVFGRRGSGERPSAGRLYLGVFLFAVLQNLWAVYWFRGSETFVLYRGPGLALVTVLAVLVTAGVTASDHQFLPFAGRLGRTIRDGLTAVPTRTDGAGDPADRAENRPTDPVPDGTLARARRVLAYPFLSVSALGTRQVAVLALVLGFGLVAGPGVGSNVFTVADTSPPGESVQVRDYEVSYAEGVTNRMVAIVNVSAFNETTNVETGGVVVTSDRRRIWQQVVPTSRLAFTGRERVRVGGVDWRESVLVTREGWSAAGGGTAYKVYLTPEDGERRLAYVSEPVNATPVVAGRNVTVVPDEGGFSLRVTANSTLLGSVAVPDPGNETTVGELRFVGRTDGDRHVVLAVYDPTGTRVQVAAAETYE
jgi:membrane associated rhomboid family serine protease